ncbi:hypothetical protein JCGZ_18949 [Jatropha curcas]|uniref:Major allergen Pru ar 1-like protein n=1 Tax=Jatropha curcas TaxID=180498 RepID=D2D960_JATCU|nr:major allergen Pru ar 1-like [Jatropha curcas]ACS96444.1 major allergen Pru ar 1-like protein [Jatropha curcas]KDP27869.1 hypothetical protein JCGZ_18949 [Jatropha curcas]
MGVVTYEGQVACSIPPAKMFKVFILDSETLLPKVLPQAIKSIVHLEGNGGPGTLRQINFSKGSPLTYVKETVDAIDKENFIFEYSVVEGDPALMNNAIEKIAYQIKFEPSPDGGSICRRSSKSYTVDGIEVNEEEIKAGQATAMELFAGIFKTFEAYALANSDA